MMRTLMRCLGAAVASTFILASTAHAEPGDYSPARTLFNLLFPPAADNPVSPEQATDVWPLLGNPPGFDDGFSPGGYLQWQTIQLHPETGAVCGNGSPYKFFINRAPSTSNMVIYMEGGGACWDYDSCTGSSLLGARNPNGIPDDYMDLQNPAASLVSPFVFRAHPYSRTKTQDWTLVYVTYCTGDIYAGDRVETERYENPDVPGDVLIWHHNGLRNVRAVIAWLKNNVERPAQLLSTGCSAGGAGTLANYYHLRRDMAPDSGFLLNDSGPIFPAVSTDPGADDLSTPLHRKIRESWGLDDLQPGADAVSPLGYIEDQLASFDANDLGTLYRGLADRFPDDRMGHTHFWQDYNFSRYSYEDFYDFIGNAGNESTRELFTHLLWYGDTLALTVELEDLDNFGYHIPFLRDLNDSHCSTIVDFEHGDIQEAGLELKDFIDNLLDGDGPVLETAETDWSADPQKPVPLIYRLVDALL